jgi:hypothetical protein
MATRDVLMFPELAPRSVTARSFFQAAGFFSASRSARSESGCHLLMLWRSIFFNITAAT